MLTINGDIDMFVWSVRMWVSTDYDRSCVMHVCWATVMLYCPMVSVWKRGKRRMAFWSVNVAQWWWWYGLLRKVSWIWHCQQYRTSSSVPSVCPSSAFGMWWTWLDIYVETITVVNSELSIRLKIFSEQHPQHVQILKIETWRGASEKMWKHELV